MDTPFSQQLAHLNRGMLDAELTEELAELVKAVTDTGKAGKITVSLTVQRFNQSDENTLKITPKISTQMPKEDRGASIMFATADGSLLRDDPRQTRLELREIPKEEKPPLRTAGSDK